MTDLSFSRCALSVPSILRRAGSLLLVAAVLAVLGGCDIGSPDASTEKDQANDATSAKAADAPVERIDLQHEPVSLAPSETFVVAFASEQHDQAVAPIVHEGRPGGNMALRADFSSLQPSSVTIQCRNEFTGTKRAVKSVGSDELGSKDDGPLMVTPNAAPKSTHVDTGGGATLVGADYEDEDKLKAGAAPLFTVPSTGESMQCTHVIFALEGADDFAPTGVRFGGDVPAPAVLQREVKR